MIQNKWLTPGHPGDKLMPAVYDDRIVWEDWRAIHSGEYNPDIYLLTLGTPETCPRAEFHSKLSRGSPWGSGNVY